MSWGWRTAFDWGRVEAWDPNDELVAHRFADPAEEPVAVLFGVPFDGAVPGRRGARQGPTAVRKHLATLRPWRFPGGSPPWRVRDLGDVPLDDGAPVERAHGMAEEAAWAAHDAGGVPVALGGDHSLTFPLAKPHLGTHGTLGVLNLDAHLDLREVHAGEITSGTSFGRLLRAGHVAGEHLAEVGVRDLATSPHDAGYAKREGVTVVTAGSARRAGMEEVLDDLAGGPFAEVDALYLSLDLDVLDQAHAPGVSAPTPGGLTTGELLALARGVVERFPVVAVDVVELAPRLDPDERTARAAAHLVGHVIAALHGGTEA